MCSCSLRSRPWPGWWQVFWWLWCEGEAKQLAPSTWQLAQAKASAAGNEQGAAYHQARLALSEEVHVSGSRVTAAGPVPPCACRAWAIGAAPCAPVRDDVSRVWKASWATK